MPTYTYEARTATGALTRDTVEATNVRQAVQQLQAEKMTVIMIKEQRAPAKCQCGRVWQAGETLCLECGKARPRGTNFLPLIVGLVIFALYWWSRHS